MTNLEVHNDDPKLGGDPGHLMWTTARLDRPSGLLVAKTRTQSVTLLGGFHGSVRVSLLDNNGAIIATTTPAPRYGVDGRWIGNSDRTDVWTYQFDPAQANAAVSLGLVHAWDPQWLNAFEAIGKAFAYLVQVLFNSRQGSGNTGTEDDTSWSDSGDPWESYSEALTSAANTRPGWQDIGHANSVKSMTAALGKLFAVTTDNQVWARDPVFNEVNWDLLGFAAPKTVDFAAARGLLFAATEENKLWTQDPNNRPLQDWKEIGHADDVVAMAALDDKLYCATKNNILWSRPPEPRNIDWTQIGQAINLVTMAAANGKLFCITNDNKLWSRNAAAVNIDWTMVSDVPNAFAMAALNGKLFIATTANRLLVRDLP
jgi:hypothetical protein